MTVQIKRTATIIQFRARADTDDPSVMREIRAQTAFFHGAILGTANDGYDLVAAFHSERHAERFLTAYYDGDWPEPGLGCYIITDATICI